MSLEGGGGGLTSPKLSAITNSAKVIGVCVWGGIIDIFSDFGFWLAITLSSLHIFN